MRTSEGFTRNRVPASSKSDLNIYLVCSLKAIYVYVCNSRIKMGVLWPIKLTTCILAVVIMCFIHICIPMQPSGNEPQKMPSGPNENSLDGLDLPPVPTHHLSGDDHLAGNDSGDVDFDDLTRRFEQLKKRK